jgi:chromosome partitioning protein
VDLDPQANATIALGIDPKRLKNSIYTLLLRTSTPKETILKIRNKLWLIPSTIELCGIEVEFSNTSAREYLLEEAIKDLEEYEVIFLDCPPSIGLLNINALVFATGVIIPIQCEFFALQGVSLLLKTIQLVRERLNPGLTVLGIALCLFDSRKLLSHEVAREVENFFQKISLPDAPKVFRTKIRTNVKLAEAPSHGKSIFEYAPQSHGAIDYRSLAEELLELI